MSFVIGQELYHSRIGYVFVLSIDKQNQLLTVCSLDNNRTPVTIHFSGKVHSLDANPVLFGSENDCAEYFRRRVLVESIRKDI